MTIKIEKGIPLPPSCKGTEGKTWRKSPLWALEVGDSVAFDSHKSVIGRFNQMKKAGWKFAQRAMIEDGKPIMRVWRTA